MSAPELRLVANNTNATTEEAARVPPHDLYAETCILSACMFERSVAADSLDFLRPEHFFAESHRRIYEAIGDVYRAGATPDLTTIHARLNEVRRLQQVGGLPYLIQIANDAPAFSQERARAYALAVYDRWRMREAIATAHHIVAQGYLGVESTQEFIANHARKLTGIAEAELGRPQEDLLAALRRIWTEMKRQAEEPTRLGAPTGFDWLDEKIYGLRPSKKVTVVAWPGVGKSAFCMQLAAAAAFAGVGVAYFTAEPSMTRDDFILRLVASVAGVDYGKLRKLALPFDQMQRVTGAFQKLGKLPMQIHDARGLDVNRISSEARRYQEMFPATHGVPLGVVVVDYEQCIEPAQHLVRAKKHEQVAYTSKELAKLAGALNLCVLAAAQRKRTEVQKPVQQDVGDSAEIERSSDTLVFLHRDGDRQADGTWKVLALIAKNRGGEDDVTMPLTFRGAELRFETDYQRVAQSGGQEEYWGGGASKGRWDR